MKRYIILILTLLTFLFSSCSNLFESSVENISSETSASPVTRYVSISGNFEMDGAYPGSGRTAFPTIPGLTGLTFIVEAQNLTDSISITNTITGGTSYNISVPVIAGLTKRYKIIVTAKQGTAEVLQGESQEFDISDESTVFSEAVRLHVLSGTGTKGGIALSVNIDSTVSITSASVTINGSTYDATNDGTRWDFTAAVDAIPTGAYPARFSFIGSSEEVFSFTQLVNIFSGLQTNYWTKNGSEQYLETDLSGNISCHITQSVIQSYEMTEIYVDASYTTTNPPEDGKTLSTGSGTFLNPLPTLDAAFSKLHDKDKDYTIYIRGRVLCSFTIPASIRTDGNGTQGNAKSITICGAHNDNSIDILDGNSEGRVLRINTSVPVTIKNLKITGGYLSGDAFYSGGGIYLFTDATLKLADGALITGNEVDGEQLLQGTGGGVSLDPGAKLFMYGTALITGNSANNSGGGIFNLGSVYLGYISETTKCELKNGYGVTGNHTGNMGGGITNSGSLYIASGTISENYTSATGGGAIYQIGDLYISGKTNIPYGVTNSSNVKEYAAGKNDICIAKSSSVYKKITVSGSLSKINKDAPVALTVDSMSTMTRGTKLVAADETNISDISAYEEAFIFTDTSTEWELFNTSDKKAIYANTPIYVAGTGTSASPRYVCGTSGNNTSGDGSKQSPYASISKAITLMTDETLPYVIKVDGTLTGKQEISSSLSLIPSGAYRAASVLIQGASTVKNADGSPRDCLDGKFTTQASGNTTLIISTTVPITFKHITITGGKSSGTTDAGGIKISNQNCDVTLDEFTYVIDNETTRCGGGIYNQGKLTVKSRAKISGNTITEISSSEDGGSAIYISSSGIVNIEGGEISSNTCTSGRGAICIYSGKCFIYGDAEICNNKSENGYGGGIQISFGNLYLGYKSCNNDNSPKEFKEWTGKIDGNTSKLAGSAIHGTGNVYMSSGTISNNNTSTYDGAAISIYRGGSNKKFIMTGGTVKNNKTQNNPGPAIALEGIPLSLSGSAYIPCGSDKKHCIQLKNDSIDATINIAGKLEPPEECGEGIVAAIQPETYDTSCTTTIMTIDASPDPNTTLTAEIPKFSLIQNPSDTKHWIISDEGKLAFDFTSTNLDSYLTSLDANDVSTPYTLYVTAASSSDFSTISQKLKDSCKYVDLHIICPGVETVSGFFECTALVSVTVPEGVKTLGTYAFNSCSNLSNLNLPSSIETLKNRILSDCKITTLTLPEGLKTIESQCFDNCTELTSLHIPASVTRFDDNCFFNCRALQEVTVASENANFKDIDGVLYSKDGSKILYYPPSKISGEIIIPEGITYIGEYCFMMAYGMTAITLPSTLREIGRNAFDCCDHVTAMNFNGTSTQWASITKGVQWARVLGFNVEGQENEETENRGTTQVICTDGPVDIPYNERKA